MVVIKIQDTKQWYDANLLKASIFWMKDHNDGRFDQAIEDEEKMLRSFFESVKTQGESSSLSSAA
jgi:hypothetical protein